MKSSRRPLPPLPRQQRGVAAIEAALVLPLMIFMLVAATELYNYLRTATLLSRTAYTVGQLFADAPQLADSTNCEKADVLCASWTVAKELAQPSQFATQGALHIAIYEADPEDAAQPLPRGNLTRWLYPGDEHVFQEQAPAGPALTPGNPDDFPPALAGEALIVVQAAVQYEPVLLSRTQWKALAGSSLLTRTAYVPADPDLLEEAP